MRGHLRANLDPLGLAVTQGDASELDPARYGFAESDYDRPIFLDFVLGLETATLREILGILKRTYCGNVGVQYMHITDPAEKAWLQQRIEGRDKEITFTREGKIAILKKLIEAEGFERFLHKRFPGTKRFGLDGARDHGPGAGADHQARRGAGRARHRHRHAAPRPPQRARRGDGQALPGDLPRVPGRLVAAVGRRGLGRRQVPPGRLVGPHLRRQLGAPVAHRQPQPPGDRQPGGARQGAGQAGLRAAREPHHRPRPRAAAAAARRRRVRRPGRDRRVLQPDGRQGLPHRRRGPLHRQQPDRLHHQPALLAHQPLSVRHRADGRGADLPRQRRRPGGGDLRRQGRHRIPPAVRQGRGHRHVLLSPVRPQRGRRSDDDPALDVPGHQAPSDDARALRPAADRREA